ncbi:PAS domain-containing protein [Spirosoma aerophilum]
MHTTPPVDPLAFLAGGGQMGQLIGQQDWTASPLGSPQQWPAGLRIALANLLHSAFPMFLLWGDDHTCFYNDAFRPSLGQNGKHPHIMGQPGQQAWPETWAFIGPLIEQVKRTGQPVWYEDQQLPIYRNGQLEEVYWTFSYSPAYQEPGDIGGVLVTCTETTQQVRTREGLLRSEQRFQNLVRDAPAGIIVLSGEQLLVSIVNQAYGRLIDRRVEELLHQPLFEVIPEAEAVFRPLIEGVRQSGEPFYLYDQPYAVGGKDAPKRGFLNLVYQPYKEADGTITGVMVLCQEVTEQVLARQQVEESERFSRTVFYHSPVAKLVYVGPTMILREANEKMLELLGRDSSILDKPILESVPELRRTQLLERYQSVLATGDIHEQVAERIELIKNGEPHVGYYDYTYKPLSDAAGKPFGVICTMIEVTAQVVARQQLEEAELALRGAIELAQLGTWSIDVTTGGLTYSDRLIEWFGYDPAARDYTQVIPILSAQDQARVAVAVARALKPGSDGIYEETYTIIHPVTGQQRVLHAHGKTVFDAEGNAIRLNGTAQDITLQRELQLALETQVQQRTEELAAANEELAATNEELEASNEEYAALNEELEEANAMLMQSNDNLQTFAYVASHDLQEPLRKIQQFGDLLQQQLGPQAGESRTYLERMQSAASRMAALIRDLLNYSRLASQSDRREPVSLHQVLQTVLMDLELMIAETGADIAVGDLPTLTGDRSQLEQLFQNLLSNALKFRQPDPAGVAGPPRIRVAASQVSPQQLPAGVKPAWTVPAYHQIEVSDNGIGFEEKYVDRIFQVFQRLHGKKAYAGTGIGLAICQKVVTNHGGAITATSQPGQGATFRVYLPVA